ncbi:amidase [Leucobacter coleopterorum]|uniref:Amidase n=1 Tax=Leucobacter coleopterorum TaxID=2714933 RepID=A0ABX6JXE2_9MICO|nr:amidase family protein [Leucobacter coleopterorum]QIM18984.1 amidase [Leucobacter coleopterorum]
MNTGHFHGEQQLKPLQDPQPGTWIEIATQAHIDTQLQDFSGAPVPIAVKANISVKDFRRSAGCAAFDGVAEEADAEIVALCRQAGAVVVGTTNMHELAFGIDSANAHYGPVRLPGHPKHSAGGSSGGSAAAVASGEVPLALGTDTGGSISIPASHCGVVGFRPSTGRWPGAGTIGLSTTRDTPGMFANSVANIQRFDKVVAESPDVYHATTSKSRRLCRPRVGLPIELIMDLHPTTHKAFWSTIDQLRDVAVLDEVCLDDIFEFTHAAEMPLVLWESRRLLSSIASRVLGVSSSASFEQLIAAVTSPDVRAILASELESPVTPDQYAAAQRRTAQARAAYAKQLESLELDALIFPATPAPAPLVVTDRSVDLVKYESDAFKLYTRNTGQGTILGAPMVTIPANVPAGSLPVGITVQGRRFDDRATLALASLLESAISKAR